MTYEPPPLPPTQQPGPEPIPEKPKQPTISAAVREKNRRIVERHRELYGPSPEDELVLEAGPDALDTDFDGPDYDGE